MRKFTSVLFLFIISASFVPAEVYKHVDESGQVHFSDRPPAAGESEKVTIRKINSIRGPAVISRKSGKTGNEKIVMYSASWCGVCKRARRYFKANNIPFREYDIERNRRAEREFRRLGGRGVPLIVIGDDVMAGFNQRYFDQRFRNGK